jgi:hypothetical protein
VKQEENEDSKREVINFSMPGQEIPTTADMEDIEMPRAAGRRQQTLRHVHISTLKELGFEGETCRVTRRMDDRC